MEKFHNMVKHFSSSRDNRKNYDSALDEYRHISTNQFQQDHNGTRIVAVHTLLKSALRLKTGTHVHCTKLNMPPFLTDE